MRTQSVPLSCTRCQHAWTGEILVSCSIELAAESMRELDRTGCPACLVGHQGTVAFGGKV